MKEVTIITNIERNSLDNVALELQSQSTIVIRNEISRKMRLKLYVMKLTDCITSALKQVGQGILFYYIIAH